MIPELEWKETDNCPSDDYQQGNASGECWGDGHYRCKTCIHYRPDFLANGQDYIDFAHNAQGGLLINGVNAIL